MSDSIILDCTKCRRFLHIIVTMIIDMHDYHNKSVFCSKFVLLLFNFGFFIAGLVLTVLSLWCLTSVGSDILIALTPSASSPTLVHLSYGLLGVGALIIGVVTLGTWSTIRENKCGLALYLFFVTIVIIGEIAVGMLAVMYQSNATKEVSNSLKTRLQQQYGIPTHDTFTIAIDYIQYQLMCCGIDSPNDWESSRWKGDKAGGPDRIVPLTCCSLKSENKPYLNPRPINEFACQNNSTSLNDVAKHQHGCVDRIRTWIKAESAIITGIGIGIAVLQLAGLIAAASLCRALRNLKD